MDVTGMVMDVGLIMSQNLIASFGLIKSTKTKNGTKKYKDN